MLSLLAPLLVLGLVIFVHELGHFLAAKWAGVYAPRFSLGWGKPLWSFRRGETEYALSWLPIGGYVRMASREDETGAMLEGGGEAAAQRAAESGEAPPEIERSKHWDAQSMIPHGPHPVPADRWFESKPLYKRLVIMLGGVVMNVLLAWVVSAAIFMRTDVTQSTRLDQVSADGVAARAGLIAGDSIIAVGTDTVADFEELVGLISAASGRELALEVRRDTSTIIVNVTPVGQPVLDPETKLVDTVGRIGIASGQQVVDARRPVGESVVIGWRYTWAQAGLVVDAVKALFAGRQSVRELGGPIAIARQSVSAARSGTRDLLHLIVLLSINLAVLNMLPIPLLDGGQILFNLAESVIRRPIPMRVREWYARIGIVVVLGLLVVVTFNDLSRAVVDIIAWWAKRFGG